MNMTAKELGEKLIKLGDRPLDQIITVTQGQVYGDTVYYFNQLDDFSWDENNQELEIKIPASEED